MKPRRLLLAFVFGVSLALTLLWSLSSRTGAARASAYTVCPAGPPACGYASIQAAVNAARDGDTIRVAQGNYSETVVITKSVTLEGGWNSTFTARDWDIYVTAIDAHRTSSVIWVKGTVSPTIEGLVVTGGDASSYLGWGGGILVEGDWSHPGMAIIRHNVITDNIACRMTSCQGYGGGIMAYASHAVIEYNTVVSNVARTGGDGSGYGGGIAVWGYPSTATLVSNVIVSNTAIFSPTGLYSAGEGGGIWFNQVSNAVLPGM